MKLTLIAKRGAGAAIASAAALGILTGCSLSWLIYSTHLPAHYPGAALAPIAAVLAVYVAITVRTFDRTASLVAIQLAAAVVGGLLTLAVSAVLIEMILCHYDRYMCINL